MRLFSLVCPALQPTAGGELARQQGGIPVYPIIFSHPRDILPVRHSTIRIVQSLWYTPW